MTTSRRAKPGLVLLVRFVLLVLLGSAAASGAQAADLRVCFLDHDLPRAEREGMRGFDVDLMRVVAEELGMELVAVWLEAHMGFSEIEESDLPLEALLAGSCDAVASVPGPMALESHHDELVLTRPYYGAGFELVGAADLPNSLEELRDASQVSDGDGVTVAVRLQSLAHFALEANEVPWSARPTTAEIFAALDSGEARAGLVFGPALSPTDRKPKAGWTPPVALRWNEHLALRRSSDELRRQIDRILSELVASGSFLARAREYTPGARPPFDRVSSRDELRRLGISSAPASEDGTRAASAPEGLGPVGRYRADPDALAAGNRWFQGVCTGYCHSTQAAQNREAPDLFDCEWDHGDGDEDLFRVIAQGVPDTRMQGFQGKLPDSELWKIVAFVRSKSRCSAE